MSGPDARLLNVLVGRRDGQQDAAALGDAAVTSALLPSMLISNTSFMSRGES